MQNDLISPRMCAASSKNEDVNIDITRSVVNIWFGRDCSHFLLDILYFPGSVEQVVSTCLCSGNDSNQHSMANIRPRVALIFFLLTPCWLKEIMLEVAQSAILDYEVAHEG